MSQNTKHDHKTSKVSFKKEKCFFIALCLGFYTKSVLLMTLFTRDVPEAEYLIRKGTDNGFKMNNEFIRITEKYIRQTQSHVCWNSTTLVRSAVVKICAIIMASSALIAFDTVSYR